MTDEVLFNHAVVHCRTGSLERTLYAGQMTADVHCRTGSLEILPILSTAATLVHCRTGSLEKS